MRSLILAAAAVGMIAPLPPVLDPGAVSRFYACDAWRDPAARPRISGEASTLRGRSEVRRRGERLIVGRAVFQDETRAEQEIDHVRYRYAGYLPAQRLHIVFKQPYEGVAWVLVDAATGATIDLRGIPVFAPDGRHFAVAASDPTFDQSGVVIYRRDPRAFTEVASESAATNPCGLRWASAARLDLRVAAHQPGDSNQIWAPARFEQAGETWTYHAPPGALPPGGAE